MFLPLGRTFLATSIASGAYLRRQPGNYIPRLWNHYQDTRLASYRGISTSEAENLNVSHSRFLSEASPRERWKDGHSGDEANGADINSEEEDLVPNGKGKLSPTSSHLLKLILPLHSGGESKKPSTVFLLHPSQPLSHVSRLILSSLPSSLSTTHQHATVSFQSTTPRGSHFRWSESTDVGDFIRDAARSAEFQIEIRFSNDNARRESDTDLHNTLIIPVTVPTFVSRTRFLRRRLALIDEELGKMEGLKVQCDTEAHRGAKRMAVSGLGALVVYWGTVARLTFWDYGWDVMEPITYLSGLSTVILGYLWFLYQGREVSYSSVLSRSISARRHALYSSRGLDIERWEELTEERRKLRREIDRIRGEYSPERDGKDEQKKDDNEEKDSEGSD